MNSKSLFYANLLFLFAASLWISACKIPEVSVSYRALVEQNYVETIRKEAARQRPKSIEKQGAVIVPDSIVCLHIFEGKYPYCDKLRPVEHILEQSLALDGLCDGPITGYHFFSIIEVLYVDKSTLDMDTLVLFTSYSPINDGKNGQRNHTALSSSPKSSSDLLKIRGAITMYSGAYQPGSSTTVVFDKQYIYTEPPKISFFSRGERLKKEASIKLHMSVIKSTPPGDAPPTACIKRIVNLGRNEVSDSKPLVFSLRDVFSIDSLALPDYLTGCAHAH